MSISPLKLLIVTASIFAAVGCSHSIQDASPATYTTEYGLGPDKWATAWLLTRRADPNAQLVVVVAGTPLTQGIAFDSPASELRRVGNQSAFEIAKAKLALADPTPTDPALDAMAAIVHEIEINFWASSGPPEAIHVENAFRALQQRYGRDAVTPECYVAFFDRVYQVLRDANLRSVPVSAERLQLSCDELQLMAASTQDLVPEVPTVDVLSAMAAGHKVIFVDVREPDEYAEAHIPGALNIPIRDVGPHLRQRLSGADYVVSYCVKDFRGFEMAKALAQVGVANSVIMRPYGIKGWIAEGLPVTGTQALSHSAAEQALMHCLSSLQGCQSGGAT